MRILIAPDKFKGSLTAQQVADRIALGLRERLPQAVIRTMPMADGGEGTADVIREACGGEWADCSAHDALGRVIQTRYVWLRERATAVIEMSAAAGLWRIAPEDRDLLKADTCGVGELMNDAARRGAKEILLGLGGSATNDGGLGMARALGFQFMGGATRESSRALEPASEEVIEHPGDLASLSRIDFDDDADGVVGLSARVRERPFPKVIIAADVRNPLVGPRGATRTFGPQKGGTPAQLDILERGLVRLADVVARDLGIDLRETPGAGAAGGLGFGLMVFCNAAVKSGFEVVSEFVGLRSAIAEAEVVITGEGRLDQQTAEGKAPAGVAGLAREQDKRVFAIVGSASETAAASSLFDHVAVLARGQTSVEEAQARAGDLLQERARELAGMM